MTVEDQQAFALGRQAAEYEVRGGQSDLKQVEATLAVFAKRARPRRRWARRRWRATSSSSGQR
jgi:hypothetical protein